MTHGLTPVERDGYLFLFQTGPVLFLPIFSSSLPVRIATVEPAALLIAS